MEHININISNHDHKQIDKQNWREAKGVNASPTETNSMLASRDYEVKCVYPYKIGVLHGIHVWWCESHCQPLFMCERSREKSKVLRFAEAILKVDKTPNYDYEGSDTRNALGDKPSEGQRWASPRELARDFISYLKR